MAVKIRESDRVVIFGAGRAGENAARYVAELNAEIVCFCDNDENKVGCIVEGVEVKAPDSLNSLRYDFVLVASMYAESIREDLFRRYPVVKEKLVILPSSVCLSASSLDRDRERKTLLDINELMKASGFDYFVDNSALLGLTRDQDLLPWAHGGVDISVLSDRVNIDDLVELIQRHYENMQIGLIRFGSDSDYWNAQQIKGIKIVDSSGATLATISVRYHCGDFYYWSFGPYIARVPSSLISERRHVTVFDVEFPVPRNTEEYLSYIYGADWRTPKPNWHWMESLHIFKKLG